MAVDLRTNVGSLEFRTPVVAASGTFGYGVEYDGHQPNAYLTKFPIGLKGDDKASAAAAPN